MGEFSSPEMGNEIIMILKHEHQQAVCMSYFGDTYVNKPEMTFRHLKREHEWFVKCVKVLQNRLV